MNGDKVERFCLGLWALIFGICYATNLVVAWMISAMGIAALVFGIVCLVRLFR